MTYTSTDYISLVEPFSAIIFTSTGQKIEFSNLAEIYTNEK